MISRLKHYGMSFGRGLRTNRVGDWGCLCHAKVTSLSEIFGNKNGKPPRADESINLG